MRRWLIPLTLLVGMALGVSGMILAPRLAGSYLPEAIRGKTQPVEGEVLRKQREPQRLLLTVLTGQGAMLGNLQEKATEIDLLIDQGDTVTLALRQYQPFVEDPALERVRKQKPEEAPKEKAPQ